MKKTEIKIPKGYKATMYQDGDKIVIEYEEGKKFKNGDFLAIDESFCPLRTLLIYNGKNIGARGLYHAMLLAGNVRLKPTNGVLLDGARLMTASERNELLDALHAEGKDWDAERMEIVDYVWRPKLGQMYYVPNLCSLDYFTGVKYNADNCDERRIERGIAFKTPQEAIACTERMLKAAKL